MYFYLRRCFNAKVLWLNINGFTGTTRRFVANFVLWLQIDKIVCVSYSISMSFYTFIVIFLQAFKFAAGLFHHCRKVHNTGYQKSTDTATIVPSLQTLRPPALIANLFDRCGIVLERFDFVEEAIAKGRCSFELDELPVQLRD